MRKWGVEERIREEIHEMILLGNEDHQSKLLLWLYVLYAIGLHKYFYDPMILL